jgi:hypothetical protein
MDAAARSQDPVVLDRRRTLRKYGLSQETWGTLQGLGKIGICPFWSCDAEQGQGP